jgi:hypothetical protein
MNKVILAATTSILCLGAGILSAQPFAAKPEKTPPVTSIPDLRGVWQAPYTPDLTKALGHDLPYTALGAERFKNVVHADDPASYCLPVGPARGIQAPMPFQIVQSPGLAVILFEYQHTYRLIYTDGRAHPADLDPFRWFGDSIGRYEGETLVVDTVGIGDRTWLDTAGHQHSDQLHLVERFQKVDASNMKWSVTFEDYKEPFTVTLPLKKQETVIMMYSCEENEKDRGHLDATKH